MKNKVQLITYIDRLSSKGIKELEKLLIWSFKDLFGGIHILPFYFPIDGADAGFDPIDHLLVDPKVGNWSDIKSLSRSIDIMADLIVNHVSSDSKEFKDFSENGKESKYDGFFLTYNDVFPEGATEDDLMKIYRPRPGLPFTYADLKEGSKKLLWTTFTSKQIDINVDNKLGKRYLDNILKIFYANGINMIRLDAAGYAIKKQGTSCFMIPETFDFISNLSRRASELGIETLVEIHSYYKTQIEIAKRVDWVYDFALPPLILHAFFFRTAKYLKHWIKIRPENAITVLDTHDGIGIIDIGPDSKDPDMRPGLVPDAELDQMVEMIHDNSYGESRKATGAAASNLDLYQVNCTYFDALGGKPLPYLMARAIQFFLPGIPQVYYTGLLMGRNDMKLLAKTNVGRDINRHYYTMDEVGKALEDPTVKRLFKLIKIRNTNPAFNGNFTLSNSSQNELHVKWTHDADSISLQVDFSSLNYKILYSEGKDIKSFLLN